MSNEDGFRIFHYPPELMNLLVDTIPLLCRSKRDTCSFFEGAGVPEAVLSDIRRRVLDRTAQISKYEISRVILERLNVKHDTHLRELREVVRRVVEFENYSSCWPNDVLKAKGLVSEIQRLVNVKDSFTRMREEAERSATMARSKAEKLAEQARSTREARETLKKRLYALFAEQDAHKRGKALESVLNDLFASEDILVREAFTIKGKCGEGVIEQIDGVVEVDGHLYLAEFKWWNKNLGPGEVSPHLVRVFSRGGSARGIFFSYTDFTPAALQSFSDALGAGATVIAGSLQEIVSALERDEPNALVKLLKAKINAAILDKQPFYHCV